MKWGYFLYETDAHYIYKDVATPSARYDFSADYWIPPNAVSWGNDNDPDVMEFSDGDVYLYPDTISGTMPPSDWRGNGGELVGSTAPQGIQFNLKISIQYISSNWSIFYYYNNSLIGSGGSQSISGTDDTTGIRIMVGARFSGWEPTYAMYVSNILLTDGTSTIFSDDFSSGDLTAGGWTEVIAGSDPTVSFYNTLPKSFSVPELEIATVLTPVVRKRGVYPPPFNAATILNPVVPNRAPILLNQAYVEDPYGVEPTWVVLTYDLPLDESSVPDPTDFSLTVNGSGVTVLEVQVVDYTVKLRVT